MPIRYRKRYSQSDMTAVEDLRRLNLNQRYSLHSFDGAKGHYCSAGTEGIVLSIRNHVVLRSNFIFGVQLVEAQIGTSLSFSSLPSQGRTAHVRSWGLPSVYPRIFRSTLSP